MLVTNGSVNNKKLIGHPFVSRSAEKVERVLDMFMRSMQKLALQAARESR